MDTQHLPAAAPPATPPAAVEPVESFCGWLLSSVELVCGLTVTPLDIDATESGWREVFGLPPLQSMSAT